VTLLLALEITI